MKAPNEFTKKDHVVEIIAAVLLALATVGSAWSAYQATRWSGVQAVDFSQAAALRSQSVRKGAIVDRKMAIDVGLFVQFAAAISQQNDSLASFLQNRFSPRLRKAVDAWLATKPLKNPDAPNHPFEMQEYHVEETAQEADLVKQAEIQFDEARRANQTGDNYILLTVVFASVLFFAGVGTKFDAFSLRLGMLSLAGVVFIIATIILVGFPVH